MKSLYNELYSPFQRGNFSELKYKEMFSEAEYNANSKQHVTSRVIYRDLYTKANEDKFLELKENISSYYNQGYGFKIIAREMDISYMICRSLINDYLKIKTRKGKSVVTDKLCEFRKQKALQESATNTGWRDLEVQKNIKNRYTGRGIQGYYFNNSTKKFVWLRSSWEYVFAKWCNDKKLKWDVECTNFKLANNKTYRPDFFIFDEENNLNQIIEIKGYWDDKLYKYYELKESMKNESVEFILIRGTELKNYSQSTIANDRKIWKRTRKLANEI
jgi:hypothetical protein